MQRSAQDNSVVTLRFGARPLIRSVIAPPFTMIRAAKIEDVREIANVHVASWRTTYMGQVPQSFLDELSVPKREAAWTAAFDNPAHRMLVAEIEDEIVGFSSFGPSRDGDASPDIGELYAIYLTEATQGCGVGKELWEQTRDLIKPWDIPKSRYGFSIPTFVHANFMRR